jgi:hypothetical protein
MRPAGALAFVVFALTLVGAAGAATPPPAPQIGGPTVTGGTASLTQFRGKPVFINVWSSW